MSEYMIFQDVKKCIGCHSCEVACKTSKRLPKGPRPCQIVTVGPRWVGGLPRASYNFISCYHCEKPWCVAACPTGAMQKRPEDGIVFVSHEQCVGCKACMKACPWGAPQWDREARKVVKCDYCKDRLDTGLKPACVSLCSTHCLHFGRPDEVPSLKRERHAQAVAFLE